jgi:hypothetical protein
MRLKSKHLILIASSLCLVTLPNLLSTQLGNKVVSKLVSQALEMPCSIEGHFSYFKSQKISSLYLRNPHAMLTAYDIEIDNISSMIFLRQPLKASIHRFDLLWQKTTTKMINEASLTPLAAIDILPLHINLTFENGRILKDQNSEAVSDLKGYLIYQKHRPIEFNFNGLSSPQGFIQAQGQFDVESITSEVQIIAKKCPKEILPEFFLSPFFGENFDLSFHFKGALENGKSDLALDTAGLTVRGSVINKGKELLLDGPFSIKLSQPSGYSYKDLSLGSLVSNITLKSLSVDNSKPFHMQDLDADVFFTTQNLTYKNQNLGPIELSISGTQLADRFQINGLINQNKSKILDFRSASSDLKSFEYSLNTYKFPIIFIGQNHLGNSFSSNIKGTLKNNTLSGSFTGSTETIESISSIYNFDKDKLSLNSINLVYKSPLLSGVLSESSALIDMIKPEKSRFILNATIESMSSFNQSLFPIKVVLGAQSLQAIDCLIQSQALRLGGIGSIELKDESFQFKNTWNGNICLTKDMYPLPYVRYPICSQFKILSGSDSSSLKLEANIDPLGFDIGTELTAKDTQIQSELNLKSGLSKVHAKTYIFGAKSQGTIEADLIGTDKQIQNGVLIFKNPPLEDIGKLNPNLKKLAVLLGQNSSGQIRFSNKDNQTTYDVDLSSQNVTLAGSLLYKDKLSLLKPITGKLKIQSLDLPFISTQLPFQLKKPCDIQLNIKSLNIPVSNKNQSEWDLDGSIIVSNLSLAQKLKTVQLDAFSCAIYKPINKPDFILDLSGDVYSSSGKSLTTGSLSGHIDIKNLKGSFLNMDLSSSEVLAKLKLDSFPTLLLDFFQTKADLPFTTTFGDQINVNIDLSHQKDSGFFKTMLVGKDTVIKLNAIKTGSLYRLSDDVVIQTRMSQELSKLFFYKKPMGVEKFSSNYPIVCRIGSKGSQFSLFPFDPKKLTLPECAFDFGRVTLDCDNLLPKALNLLKNSGNSKNISVWFQPIKSNIQNGLMNFPRFDFLVQDHFQMALWGDIDLNKNQVGMILGLTANCLQKAFGITDLPKNYVLQVPVSGPLDDVKIDSKKAASKIGTIIAMQQGGSLLEQFGGKSGGIVGGLLKELSKIPDADKTAPSPQEPFPWDLKTSKSAEKKDKKKAIRSSDSPVKQLMKMFF